MTLLMSTLCSVLRMKMQARHEAFVPPDNSELTGCVVSTTALKAIPMKPSVLAPQIIIYATTSVPEIFRCEFCAAISTTTATGGGKIMAHATNDYKHLYHEQGVENGGT